MLDRLRVKIYADGADVSRAWDVQHVVKGFTTNPTLMAKAGVRDYEAFARDMLQAAGGRPVSFEVFADDVAEMERQARVMATWGRQVYVKIPVMTSRGDSTDHLVRRLSQDGIKVNVTAVLTLHQAEIASAALDGGAPSILSVFAGRIADTGRDPMYTMQVAGQTIPPSTELLWASTREVFNVVQADKAGCHIITVPMDMLPKVSLLGRDLEAFELETVQMLQADAARLSLAEVA